jgi:hypothetical protein
MDPLYSLSKEKSSPRLWKSQGILGRMWKENLAIL